ncbi:MAG: DUF4249 domain-containing protein [Saprospiraceae bacterium]|nr:DUF4249 domain-containing protein [Saprospiraceae bacterium]
MKRIAPFFCLAVGFMLLSSCEGLFETSVDYEVPQQTPVLATTAIIPANYDTAGIFISHTTPDLHSFPGIIHDARITLQIGDQPYTDWQQDNDLLYKITAFNVSDHQGEIASLRIEANDFTTVYSEIQIPTLPKIREITYGFHQAISDDGTRIDQLKLKLDDPVDEENFYGLQAFYSRLRFRDTTNMFDTVRVFLEADELVTEGGSPLFFSDATFNGRQAELRIRAYNYNPPSRDSGQVIVQVLTFPKDYYLYLKSVEVFNNADGNPFAEPADLYSNFENGTGIFSIYQVDEHIVDVDFE